MQLAWESLEHPYNLFTYKWVCRRTMTLAFVFGGADCRCDPAIVVTNPKDAIVEGAVVDIVGWGQQTSDQTPPAGTVGTKMGGRALLEA